MNKEQLVSKAKETLMEIEETLKANATSKEEYRTKMDELINDDSNYLHNTWDVDKTFEERVEEWIGENYDALYENTFENYMNDQEPFLDLIQTNYSTDAFYDEKYVFETLTGEDYTDTHVTDYNETDAVDAVMKVYRDFMNVNGVALKHEYIIDESEFCPEDDLKNYIMSIAYSEDIQHMFTNDGESIDEDGNIITNE